VEKKDGEDEVQLAWLGKGLPVMSKKIAQEIAVISKKEPKKEPAVKEEPKKVELGKPIFTCHIPTMMCTMMCPSGIIPEQSVSLEAGPENFLVAKFGETVHTTELCNFMLVAALPKPVKKLAGAAALKRPAGAAVLKKPAMAAAPAAFDAAPVAGAGAEVAAAAPVAAAPKNDYVCRYYSTNNMNTIGIKAKFGAKNLILSFGSTRCTKTSEEMWKIGAVIVADLHAGMSVSDAKKKGTRLAGL
jgi:hypothetical protein